MADELAGRAIGERIRELRGKLYTQRQLADRAGVSVDLVRKLEQGARHTAKVASLHKIARALDVPLPALLGAVTLPDRDGQQDITALRSAVIDVGDLIGMSDPDSMTAQEAQRAAVYAWGVYWSGDHDAAVAVLPQTITDLRAALHAAPSADHSAIAQALGQVLWAAGSTLTLLRHPDAAFIATREAVSLAERGDDPCLLASARGSLAWQLMVSGRYDESERLSVQTSEGIDPTGDATMPELSVYGSLILQAGNAAARAGHDASARDYLAEASETASRIPNGRNDHHTAFGPSRITMQSTDILINLGDYRRALDTPHAGPQSMKSQPQQSRCRHLADRALAYLKLGEHEKSLHMVSVAEQIAPNWARHQALPKAVVRELLHTSRSRPPRLHELAQKVGVR
ncbi:helix-turn-helix domain-containing protein [Saccharopolyspora pogona]|uniref:helix-turn-helix domain-containing protein n=1 Tax=Saccharopolyspora pogona TaxID=333966 RepID=UPI0016843B05|nr:helix-turn-helix domain-containing protein [Saccharopolyspora pogona]